MGGGSRRREPPTSAKPEGRSRAAKRQNNGALSGSNENSETQKGGGWGAAANDQAGNRKVARAHGEPRSKSPTRQTTHSAKAPGTRGRKSEKARDNGDAQRKWGKKNTGQGGRKGKQSAKAQGIRGRKPKKVRDNGGAQGEQRRKQKRKPTSSIKQADKGTRNGKPQPGGGRAKQKHRAARGKVRRTRRRPGGRSARPGQEGQAHAHTHGTRAWRPPTCNRRCRRQHKTAPVHWPGPPWNDRRYGKPDASVTGSTHANHSSAGSPRRTPEGPARDNPIAGPLTGTMRSEPSAPASAGASGRHTEPGSRPASACPAQPPSKARGRKPPGWGKGTTVSGKPTRAPGATGPDKARRITRGHEARQRGTGPATTKAHGQVPSNNSRRVPQTWRARTTRNKPRHENRCQASPAASGRTCARLTANPAPAGYGTAAVWMDECAPGEYPAPAGYEQPLSRWTSACAEGSRPLTATNSRRPDGRLCAPQQRPAHTAPHTQHTAQQTERAHRGTGTRWPRTPHTQDSTLTEHTSD